MLSRTFDNSQPSFFSIISFMARTAEQFATTITERQAAPEAPGKYFQVISGQSEAWIRRQGSFILKATLADLATGELVNPFYCEDDATKPKLTASHPMMPVGPHKGPGGQHGWARWAEYSTPNERHPLELDELFIEAETLMIEDVTTLARWFKLSATQLWVTTGIVAKALGTTRTSVGHHDYYRLRDEGDIEGLTINDQRIDDFLGEQGAAREILQGTPRWLPELPERIEVGLPSGRRLAIKAWGESTPYPYLNTFSERMGMLLWHRQGTPSICFEPTMGVGGEDVEALKTDSLVLWKRGHARMHVMTQVLPSADLSRVS